MSADEKVSLAVGSLRRQIVEFDTIIGDAGPTEVLNRLSRWKQRTVQVIASVVDEDAAEQYRRVSLDWDGLDPRSYTAMLESQRSFLTGLIADLTEHSSSFFLDDHPGSPASQFVKLGNSILGQEWQQGDSTAHRPISAFLSYAREDKSEVLDLHSRLEANGIRPWMDEVDLLGGQNWKVEVSKAIRRSDVFVACFSESSVGKQGYVQKELREALTFFAEKPAECIYVIPVKLRPCHIPDLQLPALGISLLDFHIVELWQPYGFQKLLLSIQHRRNATRDQQEGK